MRIHGDLSLPVPEQVQQHGLDLMENGLIRWHKGNSDHPRNWSAMRKAYDSCLIISLEFLTTAVSIAGTSASEHARQEYHMDRTLALFTFTSMYLIGQAIGGILLPPYSETFGRKTLYIITTLLYSIFCIVVGAVPSLAAVFVGRFVTGALSAVPTVVVAGSIEDMFDTKARIWIVFAWEVAGTLGLMIGPIMGAYVIGTLGWRWVFYIAAIVTGITACLLLGIKESRPSRLLQHKVTSLRKATGYNFFHIENPDHVPDFKTFTITALIRPLRLLFTEPIVFTIAIMSSVVYGLVYLFTEALPIVYGSFGFDERQSSLAFIPIGIGPAFGIFSRFYDMHTLISRQRHHMPITPEDKMFGFNLAAPALAIGLWSFSWTIPPLVPEAPWILSMISLVCVGFAVNEFEYTLAGYLTDSYTCFAASANAPVAFLRSVVSASLPLFAHQMYTGLGANAASSMLAAVATVFCAAPIVFGRYGERLRQRSQFARFSAQIDRDNGIEDDDFSVDLVGETGMPPLTRVVERANDPLREGTRVD